MRVPRLLPYLLLVPVIGFELWVASLAGAPHVSERYQAYFIDKTTDCWPIEVSGEYAFGETVSLMPPRTTAANNIRRCGWIGPQDTGTWSSGPESQLRFAVPDGPSDLVLDLEVLAFVTDQQPAQTIRIYANDVGIATLQLFGDSDHHQLVTIPHDAVAKGSGKVDIDFRFPSAHSPKSAGVNNDERLLAIRLMSVKLSRAGDTAAQTN